MGDDGGDAVGEVRGGGEVVALVDKRALDVGGIICCCIIQGFALPHTSIDNLYEAVSKGLGQKAPRAIQ